MKTPQEIWESLRVGQTRVAVVCIPDIEAIQKEAYEAGRAAEMRRMSTMMEEKLPKTSESLRVWADQIHPKIIS